MVHASSGSTTSSRDTAFTRFSKFASAIPLLGGRRSRRDLKKRPKASRTKEKIHLRPRSTRGILRALTKVVVDSKYFVFLCTVLTFYALIGEDVKLIATNKPSDSYFDAVTIFCLVVFSIEIMLSCIGKRDYFLGFFFTLDVVSTCTMVLDISSVSEFVMGDGEDLEKLRSGRTARIGARAGRVVRVLRLVRILKLYKAIYEARQRQNKRTMDGMRRVDTFDEQDWGDEEDFNDKGKERMLAKDARESRVGKKLSELSIRRVILLVLAMLLILPFLQTDSSSYPPVAAYYGADDALELFLDWNRTRTEQSRQHYEKAMLRYMYYHNWFSGNLPDKYSDSLDAGPSTFRAHVFYVSVMSFEESGHTLIDDETAWEGLQIRPQAVAKFAQKVAATTGMYPYGRMPQIAQQWIAGKWTTECNHHKWSPEGIWRRGFSILQETIEKDGEEEVDYAVKCPEYLRNFEKAKYYPRITSLSQYQKWHLAFYFDLRPLQQADAVFSLYITGFICILLLGASLQFSFDANRLVLRPLEKMIRRVEIIRDDPLVAVHMADEEFKLEEQKKAKKKQYNNAILQHVARNCSCSFQDEGEPMETVILEKTIIKLGSLLALGFGEAGANIIGQNLESSDSAGVNGMVPGSRVEAIIGIARIRDFSTATEVLKSKVMTFVNQIAEIVHGVVSEFHGAANKNNGDTFLLVWRITGLQEAYIERSADFSAIAFAKILGAVHCSPTLAKYRGHPSLQQRLGTDHRVRLTFGLHSGWAIEGAVGSEFKIDASYLSPNVSIAVNIEHTSSLYGVAILMTSSVVDLCSLSMASKFRKIDRVIISGSSQPLDVYCVDLDYSGVEVDTDDSGRPHTWNPRLRFRARQFLEFEKVRKLDLSILAGDMFDECREIAAMRSRYDLHFIQLFRMGYANYFEGEWEVARNLLMQTRMLLGVEDGPSAALVKFIEDVGAKAGWSGYAAPTNWNGVHDLTKVSDGQRAPVSPRLRPSAERKRLNHHISFSER